jgi:cytidylate kinase
MRSTIAIDGPVASGKTSIGRELARVLQYQFIDTGLMYRAITYVALQRGIPVTAWNALGDVAEQSVVSLESSAEGPPVRVYVDSADVTPYLRSTAVGLAVSVVSQITRVRVAMIAQQRRMAEVASVVMVGRDIGTVVLPDAAIKIFLSASIEERTRRRFKEMISEGRSMTEDEVKHEMELRDHLDSNRTESPLRPAKDSIVVETDGVSPHIVVARLVSLVHGD